jgi:hypothetical protein
MNVCAWVTLMDVIEYRQLTSFGCFLVSESNNCFTAIPTNTPCRFIYRSVQVCTKGQIIHIVDKTLVNKVILGTWIISLHSMRFAQKIVVQLEETFDAFPTFASHAFSNGAVVTRIISIPMCKDGYLLCHPMPHVKWEHQSNVPIQGLSHCTTHGPSQSHLLILTHRHWSRLQHRKNMAFDCHLQFLSSPVSSTGTGVGRRRKGHL